MVAAPWQPLLRITHAALPVKAANRTLPPTPSARCLASVVLPVPAYPKRRKIEARPRAALSQFEAAVRAASWCGVKVGIGGQNGGSASIKNITGTFVKAGVGCAHRGVRARARLPGHHAKKNRTVEAAASAAPRVASR